MLRDMQRVIAGAAALLAAAALIVAVVALREARSRPPTYAGLGAASISQLRGLMTQDEVRALLGQPQNVFRDNARAQCWAYGSPYTVRTCFGPKRRLAWWATNVPPKHPQA
jgi:outer membrane protein assembly factor BamE (lipoprotein component of BamABCDE complex)